MQKMNNLTNEILIAMRNLNDSFMQIESEIVKKAILLDTELNQELAVKKNGMCDYELDLEISFYNDYFEDPLLEKSIRLKHISHNNHTGLTDGNNYNEYKAIKEHPLYGDFHCKLLKELYTSYLEWDEIMSLSTIWWDINPSYQYSQKVQIKSPRYCLYKKYLPIVFDHQTYHFYIPAALEEMMKKTQYSFGLIDKFNRIVQNLSFKYVFHRGPIKPISDEELLAYHNSEYLLNIRSNKQMVSKILHLDIAKLVSAPMINSCLIDPIRAMVNGTIHASFLALDVGWAINIGGGFHHAHKGKGGGMCFFNDYALATLKLRASNPSLKILYIDLDAHLGDGVIEFATHIEHFYILDIYNTFLADTPITKKSKDGRFSLIGIPLLTADTEYLKILKEALILQLDLAKPDFIFYNAGGDILINDPLGNLAVSAEGLKKRDLMVFSEAKNRHIPITMCLSGGYDVENYNAVSESLEAVIELMKDSVMS